MVKKNAPEEVQHSDMGKGDEEAMVTEKDPPWREKET